MRCFQCGKKIGYFRSFADQQYCCAEHRKEARLASAQALRDEEDAEFWSVARSRKTVPRSTAVAGPIASVFAILIAGVVLVAVMTMGPGAGAAVPPVSLDPGVKRGLLQRAGDAIGEAIRSRAPVTLHHDFQSGWADWTAIRIRGAPKARAVSLRIWNRSTALRNYQMDFSGQIEKKSLSWVFRATDEKNYYATKLLIAQPGK